MWRTCSPVRFRPPRPSRQRATLAMTDAAPVAARALVKRYGDLVAVDDVDLTVERGDVFGYLGPNGAGKTTSLRMLLGLIRPTAGLGPPLRPRSARASGAKALDGVAGFVEGPRFYPYLPARKNLTLLADYDGPARARASRRCSSIVELRDRAKDRVGGYSHGMRQRLGIAAALLREPRLLLLDEPTTGLDPAGMRDMRDLVRRLAAEGITILLSSHLLDEVEELCNRVAIIRKRQHHLPGRAADLLATRRERLPPAHDRARARARRLLRAAGASTDVARRRRRRASLHRATRTPSPRCRVALGQARIGVTALVPETREPRGALPRAHRRRSARPRSAAEAVAA